jgi:transposase
MSTERRKFTGDYKMEAIRLVTNKGMSFGEVGKKLAIRECLLRAWKSKWDKLGDDAFPGNGKLSVRDAEMAKLIAENRRLRMERDILKKATAFFANPSN